MSRIIVLSLTTGDQYIDMTGDGKLFVYVTADTRLAFDQFALSNGDYFLLLGGTTYIFDQPNPFHGQPCFVRADTGTGTMRVLVSR